jgi:hypothetical protein
MSGLVEGNEMGEQLIPQFQTTSLLRYNQGLRRGVVEVVTFLVGCAAWVCSWIPTFRGCLSVSSSRVEELLLARC